MVYITDNFVVKTKILHFLKPKIRGLYTRVVTDQERVIVARVRYLQQTIRDRKECQHPLIDFRVSRKPSVLVDFP